MKLDDYIQAFTSGLLSLTGGQATAAQTYLGQRYELHEPRKPGVVSLGARSLDGQEVSYDGWLWALRDEGLRKIRLYWGNEPVAPSLPPHMAAAFAGVQALHFQVVTATTARNYRLNSLRGPSHALSPEQFVTLVDAQEHPEPLWERMRELVHEFNEMNGRSAVAPGQAPTYLRGQEGAEVYEHLAPDLCRELQIECTVRELAFRIPAPLQDAFSRSNFGFAPPEQDFVYLYPEKSPISSEELHALLRAQSISPADVWARADAKLRESRDPSGLPATAADWPAALNGLSVDAVQDVAQAVCAALRALCEEQQFEPFIPETLKGSFGPDALEKKRARARGRLKSSQWYLRNNPDPWQFVLFDEIPGKPPAETPLEEVQEKARFQRALQAIEAFAAREESPFTETFRLGLYLVQGELPLEDLDEAHGQRAAEVLAAKGFSERARENFVNVFALTTGFKRLHWHAERITGLLAVIVSDVFGGMDSWNDLPTEDGEAYERCSAELFGALKAYFAVLLSWSRERASA